MAMTALVSPRESAWRMTLRGAGNASGVLVMSTGSVSSTGQLLLAARELVGATVGELAQAHLVEQLERAELLVLGVEPQAARQGAFIAQPAMQHVLNGREPVDQVVVLKDHRDLAMHLAQTPAGEMRDVFSAEGDAAVARLDEAVDAAQQG